ncbi:hypothetical protein [Caudoviricetes sp.]|nr:hypothetical protein [Caudoviricetes sp.]UOF81009.1 hypothetical protein [Caudoviricetes sp.]UOF81405.1 hypothetical protein [Caudoviricetes sp.]
MILAPPVAACRGVAGVLATVFLVLVFAFALSPLLFNLLEV